MGWFERDLEKALPLDGFEGASLQVPAGAVHIDGLAALLETP